MNLVKKEILHSLAGAYAKEKQHWLIVFQRVIHIPFIKNHRVIRDQAVHSKYNSIYGLQARLWKLALQDAADTMDKYWKSLFDKIRSDIYKSILTEDQKHYAYWLLKDYARLAEVLSLHAPEFKDLTFKLRKQAPKFPKN